MKQSTIFAGETPGPELERACLVSMGPGPFEIISSNEAIATASFLRPLRFNYQCAFAPLSALFYMLAAAHQRGCVYSQSIYAGKLAKGL